MGEFTVTMGTTASPRTRTRTITDSLFPNRIIPAFKYRYGQTLTNDELLDAFFLEMENLVKAFVREFEKKEARATAEAGVSDLPMT